MAIKGNGYAKTSWAYQERPVSSSKLNQWDDRIEAALELVFSLLSQAWGGGNGVLRGATADDLKTVAVTPTAMHVQVKAGYAFISKMPFQLAAATDSADVVAPTTSPRIDLVQAKLDTWSISIVKGTEAATPVAPSVEADCIALARLYLRPAMTSIKNTDDSVNGYIIDARTFL